MTFQRYMEPEFVEALNVTYHQSVSWWRTLVDDPDVFIGIRRNAINAYVSGGSVARVTWASGAIGLTVNHAYLVFPDRTGRDPYVNLLTSRNEPRPIVIRNTSDFVTHFPKIKNAVKRLAGSERQAENMIAAKAPAVLDIEAAFDSEADSSAAATDDAGRDQGRADLVMLDADGTIACTEIKLFKNAELRSMTSPAVCGQLISYHKWLLSEETAIRKAYGLVAEYYQTLAGRFFDKRSRGGELTFRVDPVPRLLILGADSNQQRSLSETRKQIFTDVKGLIPGFSMKHIQAYKNASNVRLDRIR